MPWLGWGPWPSCSSSPAIVYLGAEILVVQALDRVEFGLRQWRQARGFGVLPGLVGTARTRNHAGHSRLLDDPPKGPLSGGPAGDGRELPGGLDAGLEVDARERLPDVERLTAGAVVARIVGGEPGGLDVVFAVAAREPLPDAERPPAGVVVARIVGGEGGFLGFPAGQQPRRE